MLKNILLMSVGSFFGTYLRYLFATKIHSININNSIDFPIAIIVINAAGCFLMGIVGFYLLYVNAAADFVKFFLIIGFLGSFTTFSAFSFEALQFFVNKHYFLLCSYVFISLLVSFMSVLFSFFSAKMIYRYFYATI